MARNTGRDARLSVVTGARRPATMWTKPNSTTGVWTKAKRTGGAFKGVRKEN